MEDAALTKSREEEKMMRPQPSKAFTGGLLALFCLLSPSALADEPTPLPGLHLQSPASLPVQTTQFWMPNAQSPAPLLLTPPASQPSSTSQPASAPSVDPFRDRPINLLVYRHKKYPDGTDSKSIGLLYWHGIDPDSGWRLLAPFFFHYWDTTLDRNLWILPFGLTYQNKQNRTTLMGPVYHREDSDWITNIVFPFYWRWQDPANTYDSLTVGPYYKRRNNDETKGGVVPFVYWKKTPDSRSTTVFPFFYREREGETSDFLVTPLGFYSQENEKSARGLVGPLYLSREEEPDGSLQKTQALFPLFYRKETTFSGASESWMLSLPGVYRHTFSEVDAQGNPGKGSLLLFPVGFYSRSDTYQRRSFGLLTGFYSRTPSSYSFGLLPLLYHKKTETERLTAAPFFYRSVRPDGSEESPNGTKTLTYALIGWRAHSDAKERTTTGLLTAFYTHDEDSWAFDVLPLFYSGATPYTRYAGLFPVFLHKKSLTDEKSLTLLGPAYYRKNAGMYHAGVAPLFFMRFDRRRTFDSYGDTSITLFPLLHFSHKGTQDNLLLGPLFIHKSPEETNITLAPIARYEREEYQNQIESNLTILPFVYIGKKEALDQRWVYAFPFFYRREQEEKFRGLFPIAWYWSEGQKESKDHFQLLFPFYSSWKESEDNRGFVSLPYGSLQKNDQKIRWVGPVLLRDTETSSFRSVLPLYYDNHDRAEKSRTTTLIPAFYHHKDPYRTGTMALGLYWRTEARNELGEPLQQKTVLFPLLFKTSYPQEDFSRTFAFPVYLKQHKEDFTLFAPPLFLREKNNTFDLFAPPVYLHKEQDALSLTVAPLFYYRRQDETTRLSLLPVFGYGKGEDWRRLITPLGFYSKDPSHERALPQHLLLEPPREPRTRRLSGLSLAGLAPVRL